MDAAGLPEEAPAVPAPGSPTQQCLVEGPLSPRTGARTIEMQDGEAPGLVGALRRGARFSLLLLGAALAAFVCLLAGAILGTGGFGGGGGAAVPAAAEPPPAGLAWRSLGEGTLCALGQGDPKAMRGASVRKVPSSSRQDCQQRCQADAGCSGVEYSQGSCGLWLQPVTGTEDMPGSECLVLARVGRFRRHQRSACRAGGADGRHNGHGPAWTLEGVGVDACGVLCQAILGQNCSAVEHHSESARCKIWNAPVVHVVVPGAKDSSCALFAPSAVRGAAGAAAGGSVAEGSGAGVATVRASTTAVTAGTETETETTTTLTATTTRAYCHTADRGEECHRQVEWVKTEGLVLHPDWYPNLTKNSTFEDIQLNLNSSNPDAGCPRPCISPSLFCFVVVTEDGAAGEGDPAEPGFEVALLEQQRSIGGGVFACDGSAVYSGKEASVNTKVFMDIWGRVLEDGAYRKHDWTVKADVDAVFFPHRLRQRLWDLRLPLDSPALVKNSDSKSRFRGALEILNAMAVDMLVKNQGPCFEQLGEGVGEDSFVYSCLNHSHGVEQVGAKDLLSDKLALKEGSWHWLDIAPCADSRAVAFHPYRVVDAWMGCQAVALGLENLSSFPACSADAASACYAEAPAVQRRLAAQASPLLGRTSAGNGLRGAAA